MIPASVYAELIFERDTKYKSDGKENRIVDPRSGYKLTHKSTGFVCSVEGLKNKHAHKEFLLATFENYYSNLKYYSQKLNADG